jgi:hypothetical protein
MQDIVPRCAAQCLQSSEASHSRPSGFADGPRGVDEAETRSCTRATTSGLVDDEINRDAAAPHEEEEQRRWMMKTSYITSKAEAKRMS